MSDIYEAYRMNLYVQEYLKVKDFQSRFVYRQIILVMRVFQRENCDILSQTVL